MNRKEAEKILRDFNMFVQANDGLERGLNKLENTLHKYGFFFNRPYDLDAATVKSAIKQNLDELCATQEEGGITLNGEASIMAHKGEDMSRAEVILSLDQHDETAYVFVMLLLLVMAGAKGVSQCPVCKEYYFQFSQVRKSCGGRCRQRIYRSNMPEDKKAEDLRLRREEYRVRKGS